MTMVNKTVDARELSCPMPITKSRAKLENELIILKDLNPELFQITGQEQLAKLTAQLGASLIRWLIE